MDDTRIQNGDELKLIAQSHGCPSLTGLKGEKLLHCDGMQPSISNDRLRRMVKLE
jgi:hypothetical protein